MVPWLPWLVTKNQTELNRIKQLPVTPVSISSGQSFRTLAQRRSDDLTSVGPGDVTYHPIAVHRFDVKTWLVSNQVWYIAVQKIKGLIGIYRENIWKYLVLLHFTITVRIMTDPMTHRPRLVSSQDGTTHAGRFCWNLSIRRSGPGDLVIKDFGDFVEKNRWIGWFLLKESVVLTMFQPWNWWWCSVFFLLNHSVEKG